VDLKEKLRILERQQAGPATPATRALGRPIQEFLSGEVRQTPMGSCFVHSENFPLAHTHGEVRLQTALHVSSESLSCVAKEEGFCGRTLRRAVFLDTETTGLAGGAGTCAFLIGVGYFADGEFRIEQFFMRDFHEERACLFLVHEAISKADVLVSFNGKSFDVPILRSRAITARVGGSFEHVLHVDLLYTARRLWKHRLRSCTLSQIERYVVGHHRHGDVPGELVPQIYFDYLHSGNAGPLVGIFSHNRDDILSLVALAAKACQTFEQPRQLATSPEDAVAVGKTLEAMRRLERTAEVYKSVLVAHGNPPQLAGIALRLAACYKRLGRWPEAVAQWQQLIDSAGFFPDAYVELAKYYEHRARDFQAARAIVERALAALEIREGLRGGAADRQLRAELLYRLRRIERKEARQRRA